MICPTKPHGGFLFRRILLIPLFISIFYSFGWGASLVFTAPAGNDATGNGSQGNPFRTLHKACETALPGDTVFMLPGTWVLTAPDVFTPEGNATAWITIKPWVPGTVVFDGSALALTAGQSLLQVYQGQYAVLEGVEAVNSTGRGISVSECSHVTIRGCLVHEIDYRGIGGSGNYITIDGNECYNCCMINENQAFPAGGWPGVISSYYFWTTGEKSTNWVISNNEVHNSWGEGIISMYLDGGIITGNTVYNVFSVSIYIGYAIHQVVGENYIFFNDPTYRRNGTLDTDGIKWAVEYEESGLFPGYGIDGLLICNNIISGCRKAFSWYHEAPASGPQDFYSYRDVSILYNSCHALSGEALYLYDVHPNANPPSGCMARNNILDNGLVLENAEAWTFSQNDWIDGIPAEGQHPGSLSADPLWTSPVTGGPADGFRLQSGSLCIDAGVVVPLAPTDFRGTERSPVSPAIGAFEFSYPAVWNGSVSTDWHTPGNWTPAGIPGPYHGLTFPAGVPHDCIVSASAGTCKQITVEPGSTLTIQSAQTLTIRGSLTLNNGSALTNLGTIYLKGNLVNMNP